MTTPVSFTDQRPWVDAWNKEKMLEAVIERLDKNEAIGDAAIDAIVKDVRPASPEAGVSFLKRLQQQTKGDFRYRCFDVRDACRIAKDAYTSIEQAQPRTAGVFGLELAKTIEQWWSAHEVLRQARQLGERNELDGALDTSQAEATIRDLTPAMRTFCDAYDAMLRGEKAVSDVVPKATMFALFPELVGKDLPALHEALAELTARADEGMLLGLFNHRWLQFDTAEQYRVKGPLPGDLNMFVAYLRRDAAALRNGTGFGPSQGFGQPGTDPIGNYLRSTQKNRDEGYGLVPAFLYHLARPAYERNAFTFGDESRSRLPTYGNKGAPPVTMRVEVVGDSTRITIG